MDLEKMKIESNQSKTKKQLYSELLGNRFVLEESVERALDTQIFLKVYETKFNLTMGQKLDEADRIHLNLNIQAMLRMHKEYEMAQHNLAISKETIAKKIGYIQVIFTNNKELNRLIDLLYKGWSAEKKMLEFPDDPTNDQIDSWSEDALEDISSFIKENYIKPLTDLLDHMQAEIQDEANPISNNGEARTSC